jgi:asparagine synthase (glutamine-hydrolysing)
MCGLVTLIIPEDRPVSTDVIRHLTESLRHRGPDDVTYLHVDPRTGNVTPWMTGLPEARALSGVVFGFQRLSILDLSPAGRQPVLTRDRSLAMTFNGEIYNYVELADELAQSGATFTSHGDSEVLLKAYEHWGAACLPKLNGMWAFTLWGRAPTVPGRVPATGLV